MQTSRRHFLGFVAATSALGIAGFPSLAFAARKHTLMPLGYDESALQPVISGKTIGFHYGKHHLGYLNNMNRLLEAKPALEDLSLAAITQHAWEQQDMALFNNAAQVWNHDFYWQSMTPKAGTTPSASLHDAIKDSFGDMKTLRDAFHQQAMQQFASGWAWLVRGADGRLAVTRTPNAQTPMTEKGVTPLLTIDVWEHAYYLDYQNRRADYVDAVLDKILNWDFASANFEKA